MRKVIPSFVDPIKRYKASLDTFWLKDNSLEDRVDLPARDVIAAEIVEDLRAALDEFALIARRTENELIRSGILRLFHSEHSKRATVPEGSVLSD